MNETQFFFFLKVFLFTKGETAHTHDCTYFTNPLHTFDVRTLAPEGVSPEAWGTNAVMKDLASKRAEKDYLRLELKRIYSQLLVENDISARSLLYDNLLTVQEQLRVL